MEQITNAHVIGFLSAVVVCSISFIGGIIFNRIFKEEQEGDYYSVKILMREAVKLRFAEWVVNEDGHTTFKWVQSTTEL